MYRTILLAYDGSTEGRRALREGARLAQIFKAHVVLLAVVDVTVGITMAGLGGPGGAVYRTEDYQAILDEGAERLRRMGLAPRTFLETGEPVDRIVAIAKQVGADLVVVGHHPESMINRWLLGSVTTALNDRLTCSLLAARHDIPDEMLFPSPQDGIPTNGE